MDFIDFNSTVIDTPLPRNAPYPAKPIDVEQLVDQGEKLLIGETESKGFFTQAIDLFDQAAQLLGKTRADLYFRQGLALFEYGSYDQNVSALLLANKKFKISNQIEPDNPDLLCTWANLLTFIGQAKEEGNFFIEAKRRYERALSLTNLPSIAIWDYALTLYYCGLHSQEACDLEKSLSFFEKARKKQNAMCADFWVDYGNCALLLSEKIMHLRPLTKACDCFSKATSIDSDHLFAFWGLAQSFEALYQSTYDQAHFQKCHNAFSQAAKLGANQEELWLDWAQVLLQYGSCQTNPKWIRLALEKCHYASACNEENGLTLAVWSQALATLGEKKDQLDLIYQAEQKVTKALEIDQEDPRIWLYCGRCYEALGRYFGDFDYYYQAIEKFQAGLSLDRSFTPLWQAIGNAYLSVGKLEGNYETLNQSIKFFEKAIYLEPSLDRYVEYAIALSTIGEATCDEEILKEALSYFEKGLSNQNAIYLHPNWFFSYALTLDLVANFYEEEEYYLKAIELFSLVFTVDPNYPTLHQRLAQTLCHLGELTGQTAPFHKAIHYLHLALEKDEENDGVILDWAIVLINITQHSNSTENTQALLESAKEKLLEAAKLGNPQGYYQLSCLYSLQGEYEIALHFLEKASWFQGLPTLDEILADDWLDGLKETSKFKEFVAANPHLQQERS